MVAPRVRQEMAGCVLPLGLPAVGGSGGSWPSGKELGGLGFDPQSDGTSVPVSEPLGGSFYLKED